MARILIVEDDEWSRRIVTEVLQRAGHEVIEAGDATTARAGLVQRPALVLLDIQFPGGNGEQLLSEIRRDASMATLPVIVLTASAMSGDRERFLRLGFTAYLSKPVDVRTFATTVAGYLAAEARP